MEIILFPDPAHRMSYSPQSPGAVLFCWLRANDLLYGICEISPTFAGKPLLRPESRTSEEGEEEGREGGSAARNGCKL
jgi:hypothetical protein